MLDKIIDPENIFSFKLDTFQLKAIQSLNQGKNILVSAPTGSGKTAIAEYAVHDALAKHKRIFYTTPLKALSNQKFFDFCNQFGEEKVGLLTGDTQINREGEILILTTEIFRNMLYKSDLDKELFERIGYVVLDECHYMKDPDRGTVWEESIIYCPKEAQIIALSATVGNPEQIAHWVSEIHGSTELIESHKRPVPLRFFLFGRGENQLKPLMTPEGKINKSILKAPKLKGKLAKEGLPKIGDALFELQQKKMLPVIYFLFSRRGCEEALKRTAQLNTSFLTDLEAFELKKHLEEACQQLPWLRSHRHFNSLKKGLAAHHAGLLPALKALVERLFQKNLIKVIFATETLAAGINMPARSVVISQISKRIDSSHRLLTSSEFLQMSGRAGRRGMDEIGYVIVMETAYEGPMEIAGLAMSEPEDLHSAFNANYVMVLNLAARHKWTICKELVLKSFARFENQPEIKSLQNMAKQLNLNLEKLNKKTEEKKKFKTLKKIEKLNEEATELEQIPWPDFEKAAQILMDTEYLNSDFRPTDKGYWAADLRGDNILFMAEFINNFESWNINLSSFELAGLACAFAGQEIRWDNTYTPSSWAITQGIQDITIKIYALIQQISKIQEKHEFTARIPFVVNLIELGFDWTGGFDWPDLMEKYKTDEGDLVKCLRQGADFLKQLSICEGSSDHLKQISSTAYDLIYRSPIRDEIAELN